MREFQRRLNRIDRLRALASADSENWWKELLRLWQPSGTDAGPYGLRLAIRDNYLNFYHRGQSVARVAFDRSGNPYASLHLKYLGVNADDYARLANGLFSSPLLELSIPFEEGKTFHGIIERTRKWAGPEKNFVDRAVAQNESVVDLEIGLPRIPGEIGGAPRMDLALLEQGAKEHHVKLVFCEAKTIDDDRLRSTRPEEAEVHGQLEKYIRYMDRNDYRTQVAAAYREHCKLLVALAAMVPGDKPISLSPLIQTAALNGSNLSVEQMPRLVIFEGQTESKGESCFVKRVKTWEIYHQSLNRWQPKLFTDGLRYTLTT